MCRYAQYVYKMRFACFDCRKAFKEANPDYEGTVVCPQCGTTMAAMGLDFKPPRQTDTKAWAVVKQLSKAGVGFYSCGCNGPGYRPRNIREVDAFLDRVLASRKSPGEKLLKRLEASPKSRVAAGSRRT